MEMKPFNLNGDDYEGFLNHQRELDDYNERAERETRRQNEAADRCYNAGWTDMRSAAIHLLETEGYWLLAKMVADIEKPPSGDKST